MSTREEKVQRFLMGKKSKSSEPAGLKIQLPPFLKMDWYLSSWFEKAIFVLGFVALLWTIFSLAVFGFPWN
jgi:hypothetical protein